MVSPEKDQQESKETTEEAQMVIMFKRPTGDGREVRVRFTQRPLGLDFDKKVPLTVRRVQTHGVGIAQGVECGWQMMKINEVDVFDVDFQTVSRTLTAATRALPKLHDPITPPHVAPVTPGELHVQVTPPRELHAPATPPGEEV